MRGILLVAAGMMASCGAIRAQTNSLTNTIPLAGREITVSPERATYFHAFSVPDIGPRMLDLAPLASSNVIGAATDTPPPAANTDNQPASTVRVHVFPLPEAKWLDLPGKCQPVAASPTPTATKDAATINFNRAGDSAHYAQYARIEREGLLKLPPPPDSEIERAIDAAFRPEIIHIGHAQFSCSIIDAIARKNPLCLLNPSIFGMSF